MDGILDIKIPEKQGQGVRHSTKPHPRVFDLNQLSGQYSVYYKSFGSALFPPNPFEVCADACLLACRRYVGSTAL
jgi:hypothetical protein